ncbi:acyloxyacyl hydrolase [Cryomorphaceae bacterium 1068]|nr:acyloxyacyl hydrolase [Cryomorphaceae bacterium 1068]
MRSRWILVLIICCCISSPSFAQESLDIPVPSKKYIKYLELRLENGAMLSNGTDFGDEIVNSSYYNAVDVRLGFQNTNAYSVYSNLYRRPIMGLGWYASTFHNEDVGNPNALYYFFKMPYSFRENSRWNFTYGGAFGFSYNFSPFDEVDNPTNIFIGSYRNFYFHAEFTAQFHLSKRFLLEGGVGFKHFSNGAFSLPNAGINLTPVTVGLQYKLGDKDEEVYNRKLEIPQHQKFGILNVGFIMGSKNYDIGGRNYFKGGVGINYLYEVHYKYRLGAGIDIYYADGYEARDSSDASALSKSTAFAVNGSWEWMLNKNLYVPLAVGVYLHRNEANGDKAPYYLRAGMRYRFDNNIFFGGTIKAHGGAADIFEWTLGYTFGRNPNAMSLR